MDDCCLTVPYDIIHLRPGELPIIYKLYEELCSGGFAKVFRAVNKNTGEEVAIKVTSREKLKNPKVEQKHKSEVAIQTSLHHPNIVKAYDFFTDQFFTYLFLELCPGGSLKSLVRQKKKLSETETIKYLIDILNGLCYLHDNRIIHMDLKLDNLLIDKDGNVKIADFGLSTKLAYDDERRKYSVCGTPNYISPELLLDAKNGISYEVDIWAVGVVTYGMLTGVLPFKTWHTKETYERIKRCSYSFPPNCDLTPGAKSFIQSVLQLDPEMRPTALELQYCHWIQSRKHLAKRLAPNNTNAVSTPAFSTSIGLNLLKSTDPALIKTNDFRSVSKSQNQNLKIKSADEDKDPNLKDEAIDKGSSISIKNNNKFVEINKFIENNKFKEKKAHHLKEKGKELLEKIQMPKYMVSRFCDHNGLGYLLMNGCVGACFNDGTRMVLDPHQTFIQYWKTYQDLNPLILDPNGSVESKKISILKKFSSLLKKSSSMFEIPNEDFSREEPMLHVKYWMRTKDVTLFRMNNRNIQLNFVDRRKLIIFWSIRKLMSVSTIYDYGELHNIHDVLKRPDGDDEKWRLEMAKQLLSIMSRGNKDFESSKIQLIQKHYKIQNHNQINNKNQKINQNSQELIDQNSKIQKMILNLLIPSANLGITSSQRIIYKFILKNADIVDHQSYYFLKLALSRYLYSITKYADFLLSVARFALKEENNAYQWYKICAELREKNSKFKVGIRLIEEGEIDTGLLYIRESIRLCNPGAQFYLGKQYLIGKPKGIVNQNIINGVGLIQISMKQNYSLSFEKIGELFLDNNFLMSDFIQAFYYLNFALRSITRKAPFLLGMILEEGLGCKPYLEMAAKMYNKCFINSPQAVNRYLTMIKEGKGLPNKNEENREFTNTNYSPNQQ